MADLVYFGIRGVIVMGWKKRCFSALIEIESLQELSVQIESLLFEFSICHVYKWILWAIDYFCLTHQNVFSVTNRSLCCSSILRVLRELPHFDKNINSINNIQEIQTTMPKLTCTLLKFDSRKNWDSLLWILLTSIVLVCLRTFSEYW